MATKQILFRLEDTTAKALENKLTEKGISKQFLFSKVVDMFIHDKLSFDNSVIASSDSTKIAIDSNEVAETIKKHYLNDLATLIANDKVLIALVTEKLESNVQAELEGSDNRSYRIDNKSYDSNVIANDIGEPTIVETETAELEEVEDEVITPEKKNKPLTGYSHEAAKDNNQQFLQEVAKEKKAPQKTTKKKTSGSKRVLKKAPQELIDLPSGEEISQSKLAELTGKGTGTMSRWANGAKSRPEWFDEYIQIKTETRKGKRVKVMYRK